MKTKKQIERMIRIVKEKGESVDKEMSAYRRGKIKALEWVLAEGRK